jgi:squalene-hopene/tetraprenyl-beta-curcumene cyclase
VDHDTSLGIGLESCDTLEDRLTCAIDSGVSWLLDQQAPDGYWCGELEADTTLESDYILYLHVLGRTAQVWKLANYVRARQLPDGGWNISEGGPSELNATVKAYVGLKLASDSPGAPHMAASRRRIHELGGIERTNSFTRFYLAMTGAIEWTLVPAISPELAILPRWFWLNIYRMSSWTRAIVVPMTLIFATRSRRLRLPELTVDELFCDRRTHPAVFAVEPAVISWHNLFLLIDRVMKLYERVPWKPFRRRAVNAAAQWMIEHFDRSDGLGAIYPAMMNAVFALLAMGREPGDAELNRAIAALAQLEIEDESTIRLQPCVSPVWDTAIAMVALEEAGLPPDHPALVKAADWLLDRQILGPGDWQNNTPSVEPGGWAFEFRNEFYPDLDDTAFVLMALAGVAHPDRAHMRAATSRALDWLVAMQNRDGGWGAFDRDNDLHILTQVPFADHNAMIDPSSADVTARVLECFARFGRSTHDPVVARGVQYLRREQTPEGAWYGRWGVNYIYGTSGVLRAAEALGIGRSDFCRRGAAWLAGIQNADGGFGETCASYDDPAQMGRGPTTPSQTAWALIGLLAEGAAEESVTRAVRHLIDAQNAAGSWDENATTGTGFPRVFYLRYHLYCHSFPLSALARYRAISRRNGLVVSTLQSALA